MEEVRCIVLMATYNGQEFIRQQLESIINQSWTNWKLIIRDDGSSDGTLRILKEYAAIDNRITVLVNETAIHGPYINFWYLINYVYSIEKFDYYFFSDQDDIWLPDKLKDYIEFAEKKDKKLPLLLYSDMRIIDENNNITLESINKVLGIGNMSGNTEFYSAGFVWGCAAMINEALFFSAPPLDINNYYLKIMSHDNFYTKICLIIGEVCYLDKPYIYHRRHSNNVTTGNTFSLNIFKIIKKGLFGYKSLSKTHALGYNQTLITINHMRKNGITSIQLDEIEKAIVKGGVTGVRILKKHKVKRRQKARSLGIYVVMLFKSYKKFLISEFLDKKFER